MLPADIDTPKFKASATSAEHGLTVSLRGTADAAVIAPLSPYLLAIHQAALAQRVSAVVVDLQALEFMNSSCFKAFVSWLGKLIELGPTERYRVVFDSSESRHWQRRSLGALATFGGPNVEIRTR